MIPRWKGSLVSPSTCLDSFGRVCSTSAFEHVQCVSVSHPFVQHLKDFEGAGDHDDVTRAGS